MKSRILLSLALLVAAALTLWGASTKFYSDDPILRDPETRDASGAKPVDIDLTWDLAYNLFAHPGDATANVRAQNINTIDEVPDSNWFTNRILARPVSIEEAVKGPIVGDGPAPPPWTIIRPKEAGAAPGFLMKDSNGTDWFVSFDAKDQPEAATSSIIVANKIFWTLGYWQVENHLITIRPGDLKIAESARMKLTNGKNRPMRQSDLDNVLRRSEITNGAYRAVAGRQLPGTVLGGFKYVGTRPDDPNDIVPHEHRRELRALKVFGAWTNLVDMKAGNTLDTIVQEGGKSVVRHYLQDVGSTFGTGALLPREYDEGWEYLFEGPPLKKRLYTFGFYLRPWQTADYKEYPSIGRFEAEAFDPTVWKPRVPTAAFTHALPDDDFWAARRVMAFSDEMIRAIVKTGRFSDAAAEKHLADMLIARRDKIGKAFLPAVNPLVGFAFDGSGTLTFINAATAAGADPSPGGYSANWAIFDNLSGLTVPYGAPTTAERERIQAPPGLPQAEGMFIRVRVAAVRPTKVSWANPVNVYFRRVSGGWKLVGLER
jgi:hypothetical protein